MQSPSRRAVLTAGSLAVAGLLAACSSSGGADGSGHGSHKADPDLPIRARAVAATDTLVGQYDALLAGAGADTGRLQPLRAELLEHRAALAVGLPAAEASPSARSAQPSATATGVVAVPPAVPTLAALASAERTTAQARLADLDAASPGLARLLASVSAADALHAVLLGDPTPLAAAISAGPAAASPSGPVAPSGSASRSAVPSSGSPEAGASPSPLPASTVTALQAALAAEHAAVYGYGVIGARIPVGPKRDDARTVYASHQARRDAWHGILGAGGATPAAAAPGYQLPFAVPDAATAAKLAAYIETRLTGVYGDLVAATGSPLRISAAAALRESVLQATHWGGVSTALPGMPAPVASSSAGPSS